MPLAVTSSVENQPAKPASVSAAAAAVQNRCRTRAHEDRLRFASEVVSTVRPARMPIWLQAVAIRGEGIGGWGVRVVLVVVVVLVVLVVVVVVVVSCVLGVIGVLVVLGVCYTVRVVLIALGCADCDGRDVRGGP